MFSERSFDTFALVQAIAVEEETPTSATSGQAHRSWVEIYCSNERAMLTAPPRANRMERISVRTTKKVKKVVRREWTPNDVRVLKKHSKAKTPIDKISKETKRTIGALRVKASQLGIGLGHQR